jgi:hypothetical protein
LNWQGNAITKVNPQEQNKAPLDGRNWFPYINLEFNFSCRSDTLAARSHTFAQHLGDAIKT